MARIVSSQTDSFIRAVDSLTGLPTIRGAPKARVLRQLCLLTRGGPTSVSRRSYN